MQDIIKVEILGDGTIKFTTPKVSGANHQSADAFLKGTSDLLGGQTTSEKRTDSVSHVHGHSHTHLKQ